jgi:hypothetical protein
MNIIKKEIFRRFRVNEGNFVLNIDFIMALKPDGLCVAYMKQLNKTAYNFSVSLILIPFFIILNCKLKVYR